MKTVRHNWTDERLDDMSDRMDQGFARVDAELRALNNRFDALQRTLIQVGFSLSAAMIGVMAATIFTQL